MPALVAKMKPCRAVKHIVLERCAIAWWRPAAFIQLWFKRGISREALPKAPAVIYNDQDHLHSHTLLAQFGLHQQCFAFYYTPSATAFAEAIFSGLGYGLVPEYQIADRLENGALVEILPECQCDVPLYWHHWQQQSPALRLLTEVILHQASSLFNQSRF